MLNLKQQVVGSNCSSGTTLPQNRLYAINRGSRPAYCGCAGGSAERADDQYETDGEHRRPQPGRDDDAEDYSGADADEPVYRGVEGE